MRRSMTARGRPASCPLPRLASPFASGWRPGRARPRPRRGQPRDSRAGRSRSAGASKVREPYADRNLSRVDGRRGDRSTCRCTRLVANLPRCRGARGNRDGAPPRRGDDFGGRRFRLRLSSISACGMKARAPLAGAEDPRDGLTLMSLTWSAGDVEVRVPRCDRNACVDTGVFRPVFFLALIGQPATAHRLSPTYCFCPVHRNALHRFLLGRRGRTLIEQLLARVLALGGRANVDWDRSRIFFTSVRAPDLHAPAEPAPWAIADEATELPRP